MTTNSAQRNNEYGYFDQIIGKINEQTYSEVGANLLQRLMNQFGETLGLDYVFIGRFSAEQNKVHSITVYPEGSFPGDFEYDISGTPCETVINDKICYYRDDVTLHYPDDLILQEAKIESYIGVPLLRSAEDVSPMGVLVALSKKTLPDAEAICAIFKLFGYRASAELGRETCVSRLQEELSLKQEICDLIPAGIALVTHEGELLFTNNKIHEIPGLIQCSEQKQYLTSEIFNFDGEEFGHEEHPVTSVFIQNNSLMPIKTTLKNPGQAEIYLSIYGSNSTIKLSGREAKVLCILDVTEQVKYTRQHNIADKIFKAASEGIMITDSSGNIIAVNPAFENITGYSSAEVLGKNPKILRSDKQNAHFYSDMWYRLRLNGLWEGEIWNKHKNGTVYPEFLSISQVHDHSGKVTNYIGIFRDETPQKKLQNRVYKLTNEDAVTGLPNYNKVHDEIIRRLKNGRRVTAFIIDLHQFKSVNECLGFGVGNKLMRLITERLAGLLGESDFLAKLQGDEFIIIAEHYSNKKVATQFVNRILDVFGDTFSVDEHLVHVGCNIGICISDHLVNTSYDIINAAEVALTKSVVDGVMKYSFFSSVSKIEHLSNLKLEAQFKVALDQNQIQCHYQPQVDLVTGKYVGMEVLARWMHPTLGMIPPDKFIPLAEKIGLIELFTEKVLFLACKQVKYWLDHEGKLESIAVNIVSKQLCPEYLPKVINEILEKTGLDPKYLEIEITESALLNKSQALKTLSLISGEGVRIALDDFGTGYSSLSYLKDLPINKLKIDRSFINGVPQNKGNLSIVKAIIALAHSMDMAVLSEGVENEDQAILLESLGCYLVQGFLYGRPSAAPNISTLLGIT